MTMHGPADGHVAITECTGFVVHAFHPQSSYPTCCRIWRARMQAYVYKSQRKADTFVFLAARDDYGPLPAAVRTQLEPLVFVLEVTLTPGRKLARTDADTVRGHLLAQGFHIQFPPPPVVEANNADG